jgi:hypothetical protein
MARRTMNDATAIPGPWTLEADESTLEADESTLEADQLELEAYVTALLHGGDGDDPTEPTWIGDALQASWAWVLPEIDALAEV